MRSVGLLGIGISMSDRNARPNEHIRKSDVCIIIILLRLHIDS